MTAGQALTVKTSVYFGSANLLPNDYSVVVWSTGGLVGMENSGDDEPSHFPSFCFDEGLEVTGLDGSLKSAGTFRANCVDQAGTVPEGSSSSTGGSSGSTDEQTGDQTGDQTPDQTTDQTGDQNGD